MRITTPLLFGLLALPTVAWAAPGDSWILPIAELNGTGWIEHPGAGYAGASAWEGHGMDGIRRAIWKTNGTTMPTSTELYTIDYFIPISGPNNWQPIESIIGGASGELYPIDARIPWAGMWGTNHEYIGAYDPGTPGTWHAAGAGPHTPENATYTAGANGTSMWLTNGSWLYAKWDFGWDIDNTVSAIRLTQVTPEPSTLALLALSASALFRRPRRTHS